MNAITVNIEIIVAVIIKIEIIIVVVDAKIEMRESAPDRKEGRKDGIEIWTKKAAKKDR